MQYTIVRYARWGMWAAMSACLLYALYLSREQFITWRSDPYGGAYLVPPFRSIDYFIQYAFVSFWLGYVISFVIAGLCLYGARILNKRRGGMLFETEELYFLATGIMVSSHPGWIFYGALVLITYALATFIASIAYGPHVRVSFYYFWLPCAIITVVLNVYLRQYAWYAYFLI